MTSVVYEITEKGVGTLAAKQSAPLSRKSTIHCVDSKGNKHSYWGSFYCAYKEDGTVFVWIPRWIRTDTLPDDEIIKGIIIECLEAAPLAERKHVGITNNSRCNESMGEWCDDHDLQCNIYSLTDEGVTGSGRSYDQPGVKEAYHNATMKLCNFVDERLSND